MSSIDKYLTALQLAVLRRKHLQKELIQVAAVAVAFAESCPKRLRSEVWRFYKTGQENRPELVTTQYLDTRKIAIKSVEDKEAREDQTARQAQLL